jgi:multicomponent Na+:H+ antiporter subunit D
MNDILLVLPILIPLVTAALAMLAWRSRDIQRWLGLIGAIGLFIASLFLFEAVWNDGIQAVQLGGWQAPFGITLVADVLSASMVVITGFMGLAVAVYSLASMDHRRESFGYYPLFQILLMGVSGAFLTGDMFNLFVWFEVMLISSFVLLALGGERGQMEGALKYVTLNLFSSVIFLIAIGVLYGLAGTLNMADLSVKLADVDSPGIVTTVAMLFLLTFGVKAAVFPLFFWLPASYHTTPVAVSAIFAGLLTKVGVYAIIRTFTLIFTQDVNYTHTLILVVAGFTMVTGVLGAVAQNDFRRILSFHIVSQIGYMIMGLGLFTPLALAGAVFYVIHHIIVKTNLFLVSGVARRLHGTEDLARLGGLYKSYPLLSILFLIPALSLSGLPPLSGFFAKLSLVRAGLEAEQYLIVAIALAVGILTFFSMTKIWAEAFWKPLPAKPEGGPDEQHATEPHTRHNIRWMMVPIAALALTTISIGLGVEFFFSIALESAEELMNPSLYVQAVLGGSP